ncbi:MULTISPECIES: DUF6301 family protein [unclassified Streptomyces]|uniref:DUF6301 family protein n=1 Tax=unclassified Streptomyces TaxID=2593676 RepID=UPI00224E3B94|nr:DUF6301 family protein [Streptomyces sp. NBC_01789]MCX4447433.1 DUF6301 family protein [Streptomyces sp. NBC_01789]
MTQWHALSSSEVVELAARLRSTECTWELGATSSARRSSQFTRKALMIRPQWDQLRTGFERAGRRRRAEDEEMVERVRLRLTDYAAGWAPSLDAFARMAAALETSLGAPTDRRPGTTAAIHWEGPDTTLVLENVGDSVYLELVTNKRLSLDEELLRLEEEELL